MKAETVKLLNALLEKAASVHWVSVTEAQQAQQEIKQAASRQKKKVKSPELGT